MKKILIVIFGIFSIFIAKTQAQKIPYSDQELKEQPYWIEMMQAENPNFFDVKKAYDLYFENHEKIRGSGFKQFERWAWKVEGNVLPDGSLPPADKVLKAYQRYLETLSGRGPITNAGNWVELGPVTYPSNNTGQVNGTGRVNAIAFHPSDPDKFWVGAPAGGLWFTEDGGDTYICNTDQMPTLGVSSILVDPYNPDIIYIGTGDRDANDAPGLGVYKSTDGGLNFSVSNSGMGTRTVGMMVMDPGASNIIIAATSNGIYKTTDSGDSWTQTYSGGHFKDIKFHPANSNYVYATKNGDFYRSIDNGDTWNLINSGLIDCTRLVIGVSEAEPESVLCLLTGGSQIFQGIFKSINAGQDFTRITPASHTNILGYNDGDTNSQAWYDLCMLVDPSDIDHILVGSVNIHESLNGGIVFTKKTHWSNQVHADQHTVGLNRLNGRIYEGHDGGLHYSDDYFDSWTQISSGLNIAQAYRIGQCAQKKDLVINGYQDNGSANYDAGNFTTVLGGDGMESAFDYENASYAYSTYIDQIKRSSNGGYGSWSTIAKNGLNGIDEGGAWVTPYMLHVTDPNTLFFGYNNIWRSNNVRNNPPSWTKISDNLGGSNVYDFQALAQSEANIDLFYGVRKDNTLFRSDNVNAASPGWTDLTPNLPASGWIDDVITHPTDPEIVYIVQSDRVYKSGDMGITWTDISVGLPSGIGLNCLVFEKNSNEGIYAGAETGVFYRNATLAEWIPFDGGLPVVDVTELEIYYGFTDSKLRAATFGRGLWESSLYHDPALIPEANFRADKTSPNVDQLVSLEDLSAFDPDTWSWNITPGNFSWENGTDANSQHPELKFTTTGVYDVSLTASNSNGSDTKTIHSYISVYVVNSPNCTPVTQELGYYGMGIYRVSLHTLDFQSGQPIQDHPNPPEGYLDLISSQNTILESGNTYDLVVELGPSYTEYWNVYLDYNNDGDFEDADETIYEAPSKVSGEQTISISTIPAPVLNTILRMRIICDYNSISGPCHNPTYGQAEDYGIVFKDLPVLTTTVVINIENDSAQSGGDISDEGSSAIIARGVVIGLNTNPTLENNWGYTDDGIGTGTFTSMIGGLMPGRNYFVRAYAINEEGISYGQNESFATTAPIPVLTTDDITDISSFTATCGGNILSDGGLEIMERGTVWGTGSNPTLGQNTGKTEDGTGDGVFTSFITGLFPNTTYYVRSYARNGYTLAYGNEKSFITESIIADPDQSSNLVFSNITTDKMDVSWTNGTGVNRIVKINTENTFTPPANGTDPPGDPVYGGGEQVIYNGPGSQVTVTSLDPSTSYYFFVFDYNGTGGTTVFNTSYGINNPSSADTYCLPTSTNSGYGDHILEFKLNTIDHFSGAAVYSDFSNISTPLLPGNTYDVGIKVGYQNYINLWIDWNNNSLFEANERLISNFLCPVNVLTFTQVNLPESSETGNHLLRVRTSYASLSDPCANTSYGEAEDYTVDYKDKISWTGTTNYDWLEPSNWDVGLLPSNLYEVVIRNTAVQPLIRTGQTAYAKKVTLDPGGGIQIFGDLEIAD